MTSSEALRRRIVVPEPLTSEAYEPFGEVVSADRADVAGYAANQGSAARRDFVAELRNLRPEARLNLAAFRCAPRAPWPFSIVLLERHAASTQVFIPMNATRYLIVVAPGTERPEVERVRAFVATGIQGISYRPGVWHHPMLGLDRPTDFACMVWEDGSSLDCETLQLGGESFALAHPDGYEGP